MTRLSRDSAVRWGWSPLPFLSVGVVAVATIVAGESTIARDVTAWLGVSPSMVGEGYLGGNSGTIPPNFCAKCDSTGNVQCPDYNKVGCGQTYSSCYCSKNTTCSNLGQQCTGSCVQTGNSYECGTGWPCSGAITHSCN